MRFLVEESDRNGLGLSLCNVKTFEDAAKLHFKKVELHNRHKLCMNTGGIRVQVNKLDWTNPLAGVTESRCFLVARVKGGDLACTPIDGDKARDTKMDLTGPKRSDPTDPNSQHT